MDEIGLLPCLPTEAEHRLRCMQESQHDGMECQRYAIESIGITGRIPPCSASILFKENQMVYFGTYENPLALEAVQDIDYTNIDNNF